MHRLNSTSFQPATPAPQPAHPDAAPTPAQNTPWHAAVANNTTSNRNAPDSTPISSALDSFLFEVAELTQIASSCGMRIADFHALTRTPEVAEQLTARRELARERLDSIITDAKAVAFRALTVLCADGMVHAQDDHLPHKTRLYYAEITRRAASLILRFAHAHDTAHLNGPGLNPDPDDAPINFNDADPSSSPSSPSTPSTQARFDAPTTLPLSGPTPSSTPGRSPAPPTPPSPFSAPPVAEVRPLTPHVPTVRLPKPKRQQEHKPKQDHNPNTPQSPPPNSGAGAAVAPTAGNVGPPANKNNNPNTSPDPNTKANSKANPNSPPNPATAANSTRKPPPPPPPNPAPTSKPASKNNPAAPKPVPPPKPAPTPPVASASPGTRPVPPAPPPS